MNSTASLPDYLASDFAGLDASVMQRCMSLDGRRMYLSGATGFFGKNILALFCELQRRGAVFDVTALSRNPDKFLAAHPWSQNLPWLEWEAGDASLPWPGSGRFDLLLHAATDTGADANVNNIEVFEHIVSGSRQAAVFAATHGVARVLLSGSGAEYGTIPRHFAFGVSEKSMLACDVSKPESAYGEGKRVGELLLALQAERHGFDVINTRCFAFVGPGLPINGHFAIGNFVRDALLGRPIQLKSFGEAFRSYLYGADLAVWLLILLLEAGGGTTVNVGSDASIRIVDLAHRVRDRVNPKISVLLGEQRREEARQFYVPSIDVAKGYGLDVWTSLDRAITRTAEWYQGSRFES